MGGGGFIEIKSFHLSRLLHNLFRSHWGNKAILHDSTMMGIGFEAERRFMPMVVLAAPSPPQTHFLSPKGQKTWMAIVFSASIFQGPHSTCELEAANL